jgi:uncharacterized protein (TIGR03000 family)
MRPGGKLWLVPVLLLMTASPSQAQIRTFGGFGGGWNGGWGGWNSGWNGGFGGFGNLGFGPNYGYGFGGPWGGVPGISYSYFNPSWTYATPFAANGFDRSGPVIFPGFSAAEPPRMRPSLYPAIPEPTQEVIIVALGEGDKDRARIDMQVPAANAQVFLDGILTKQTGVNRRFVTPKLNPGRQYSFDVHVVWQDETGTSHELLRTLNLRAGEMSTLDLRKAP